MVTAAAAFEMVLAGVALDDITEVAAADVFDAV